MSTETQADYDLLRLIQRQLPALADETARLQSLLEATREERDQAVKLAHNLAESADNAKAHHHADLTEETRRAANVAFKMGAEAMRCAVRDYFVEWLQSGKSAVSFVQHLRDMPVHPTE